MSLMTTETEVTPRIAPSPYEEPVPRYKPDPDHCPNQRVRQVRKIRRVIEP
jgi:hypothetical protein